jgi:hypothetical protein
LSRAAVNACQQQKANDEPAMQAHVSVHGDHGAARLKWT